MKRTGRKPLPPAKLLAAVLSFRAHPKLRRKLEREAARHGWTMSEELHARIKMSFWSEFR